MMTMAGIEEWQCYMFGHKWVEKTNSHYHYIVQVCERCGKTGWGGHYSTMEENALHQKLQNERDNLRVTY